jgi:hypothetical protein
MKEAAYRHYNPELSHTRVEIPEADEAEIRVEFGSGGMEGPLVRMSCALAQSLFKITPSR